jgi:hypothetical protein
MTQGRRWVRSKRIGITRRTDEGNCTMRPEMMAIASGCCISEPLPDGESEVQERQDGGDRRYSDRTHAVLLGGDQGLPEENWVAPRSGRRSGIPAGQDHRPGIGHAVVS